MATMKKGITVPAPEWWKHLRPWCKRQFWKRQRQDNKRLAKHDDRNAGGN